MHRLILIALAVAATGAASAFSQTTPNARRAPSAQQLAKWLKSFPAADTNKDGTLTVEEANAFRKRLQAARRSMGKSRGAPRSFPVDPGWGESEFPKHAVSLKSPEEIRAILNPMDFRSIIISIRSGRITFTSPMMRMPYVFLSMTGWTVI